MQRNRVILIAAGCAVGVLLGGLLYAVRSGGSGGASTPAAGPEAPAPTTPTKGKPRVRRDGAPAPRPDPTSPDLSVAPNVTQPTIVRDHTNRDEPPAPRSPIDPNTVAAVRTAILPKVTACAAPLRTQVPPVKGRLSAIVSVQAAGGTVSVTDVQLKPNGFDNTEVLDCIREAFATMSVAAEGQADAKDRLYLPFDIP
jgi:hypothetical protein